MDSPKPMLDNPDAFAGASNATRSLQAGLSEQMSHPRLLSPAISSTPRSSGEFYSLSNNSSETLASEYQAASVGVPRSNLVHSRRKPSSLSANYAHQPKPETLMMGYAQVSGSFSLDTSLVDHSAFDEIKRKGVVGGQGGGVIGVEHTKRDSGVLKSLGWSGLSGSIGNFLSGNELSSMKEMRGVANSKAIPLLTTPQSILFVDLRLEPGQSTRFRYSFKLPKGLPPSHRGKAIKISYKLVIGTQRSGGLREQQIRTVEIPIRVLAGVNRQGVILGHNLMAPYILLHDQAEVETLQMQAIDTGPRAVYKPPARQVTSPALSLVDFKSHVNSLLFSRLQPSDKLLSPTAGIMNMPSRRRSSAVEPVSTTDAIDIAIQYSNMTTEGHSSANRFEITRDGKRVAVVMLTRPAYRLGETVHMMVDFTNAEIPCYAVHFSLESSEKIDPSLALRSEPSIHRFTKKVYAARSETTLFSQKVTFAPTIPAAATPEFVTSGINLEWRIRVEFATPLLQTSASKARRQLLDKTNSDERGIILAATEILDSTSFEVEIPIRVYGSLVTATSQVASIPTNLAI